MEAPDTRESVSFGLHLRTAPDIVLSEILENG